MWSRARAWVCAYMYMNGWVCINGCVRLSCICTYVSPMDSCLCMVELLQASIYSTSQKKRTVITIHNYNTTLR